MSKIILYNEEARKALKRGVDAVANAVRVTIGPRGRNVVLDKGYGSPTITNDGVSIAKEITLKNKFENMGAEIVKEVAQKTNDVAGDGTTTSVVLAQALIAEGMKHIESGAGVLDIRAGMERASQDIVIELKKMSKPIKTKDEIEQVATISAESSEIGSIIATTIQKVGKDGVVTVEESPTFGIESDIVKGLQFDKGYISQYFVTNPERMEAEYRDVSVLVTDKKISVVKEILPLLEKLAQTGKKELVIIADDVDGEALTTFVLNKLRGGFNILAVKAPGYGDRKKEQLQDIATVLGATLVSEEMGVNLEQADTSVLGRADKVVSTKDTTTIIGGKGKKSDIDERIAQAKAQKETTKSKFDIERMDERIAKLSGGVAVIRVGAATETEMKYLKLKIEDAVNATKAAIEEGIVTGGGTALIESADKARTNFEKSRMKEANEEFKKGYAAVIKSCEMPLRQIATNCGDEGGSGVLQMVREELKSGKKNAGYNASLNIVVPDMFAAGIIDPVKVTRSALENAVSAAAILLTTEVAIAEEPKEEKPMPDMGGGMGY